MFAIMLILLLDESTPLSLVGWFYVAASRDRLFFLSSAPHHVTSIETTRCAGRNTRHETTEPAVAELGGVLP